MRQRRRHVTARRRLGAELARREAGAAEETGVEWAVRQLAT